MGAFEGRKLLIFGGVAPLKEIILDCKEQGIYTIITDINENAPARPYADEFWNISVLDVDTLYGKCIENHVTAVMNYCADMAQKPYQRLCEMLGIKCTVTKEQIDIMTNKDLFAECCRKYGVGTIPQYQLDENDEPICDGDIEYPLVIKPADNAASKGLTFCKTPETFHECLKYSLSFSNRKKVVIQKYMQAPECCVKYVACDGNIYLTSMSDVYYCVTDAGERVYLGTSAYPSRYYDEFLETTDRKVRNMLRSIGIQNGAISLTGFYDHGVFRFFDPSLRMGGAQDWIMVSAATGLDISQMLTRFAMTGSMGDNEVIKTIDCAFASKASALLYFDIRPGTVGKIEGIQDALQIPCVCGYHQIHFPGDVITGIGTANNVAIRFILSCKDKSELKDTIAKVQSVVRILDSNGKNMVISPFNKDLL